MTLKISFYEDYNFYNKNLKTTSLYSKFDLKFIFNFRLFIGIKKLLGLIDMTRQVEPNYRVIKFLTKLEDEGCLE